MQIIGTSRSRLHGRSPPSGMFQRGSAHCSACEGWGGWCDVGWAGDVAVNLDFSRLGKAKLHQKQPTRLRRHSSCMQSCRHSSCMQSCQRIPQEEKAHPSSCRVPGEVVGSLRYYMSLMPARSQPSVGHVSARIPAQYGFSWASAAVRILVCRIYLSRILKV